MAEPGTRYLDRQLVVRSPIAADAGKAGVSTQSRCVPFYPKLKWPLSGYLTVLHHEVAASFVPMWWIHIWNGDILSASWFCRAGGSAVAYLFLQETLYNNMQQVPYRVPPYFFVAGRCLPLAGLFLALMLAAAQVAAQQTTLVTVTITAVGTVASSGLVEVDEGDDVVFELTRTGDLTSPLTVTVAIDEPRDADRVLDDTAPFVKTVIFSAGQSTVQLSGKLTNADDEFEEDTDGVGGGSTGGGSGGGVRVLCGGVAGVGVGSGAG